MLDGREFGGLAIDVPRQGRVERCRFGDRAAQQGVEVQAIALGIAFVLDKLAAELRPDEVGASRRA
jgi:hypothetical protein